MDTGRRYRRDFPVTHPIALLSPGWRATSRTRPVSGPVPSPRSALPCRIAFARTGTRRRRPRSTELGPASISRVCVGTGDRCGDWICVVGMATGLERGLRRLPGLTPHVGRRFTRGREPRLLGPLWLEAKCLCGRLVGDGWLDDLDQRSGWQIDSRRYLSDRTFASASAPLAWWPAAIRG